MKLNARFALAATLVATPVIGLGIAAPAQAAHHGFCGNVLLQNADTCPTGGDGVVTQVASDALSSAKTCAQMVSPYDKMNVFGGACTETEGGRVVYLTNAGTATYNPAVHNHSTHQGRFTGSYDN